MYLGETAEIVFFLKDNVVMRKGVNNITNQYRIINSWNVFCIFYYFLPDDTQ